MPHYMAAVWRRIRDRKNEKKVPLKDNLVWLGWPTLCSYTTVSIANRIGTHKPPGPCGQCFTKAVSPEEKDNFCGLLFFPSHYLCFSNFCLVFFIANCSHFSFIIFLKNVFFCYKIGCVYGPTRQCSSFFVRSSIASFQCMKLFQSMKCSIVV